MNELVLPWPSKDLSPNGRVHWARKAAQAKSARSEGYIFAVQAKWNEMVLPEGRLHLWWDFYPPTKRQKAVFLRDTHRNKTGFIGVKWVERTQRFQAYIRDHKRADGAKVYCGSAKTAEEAARLYDTKARAIYGRSAVLNFPTPRSTPRSKASGVDSQACCEAKS